MRIAVVGAGRVGCYVGGHLAGVADVTLVGRSPIIGAIRREGLTVTALDGRRRHVAASALRLETEISAVAGADVVLVTTKAGVSNDIAAQLGPYLLSDTVVISVQNGLRNATVIEEGLAQSYPSRASRPLVLSAMLHHNVVDDGPASYVATTNGGLVVKDHPRVDPFVRACREAGLSVEVHPDMRQVLFGKLLLNLNNAVNALSGRPLAEELRDRDLRRVLAASQDEALAVAAAADVAPTRFSPLPVSSMPTVLRAPTPVFSMLARTAMRVSPQARSSMADDLARGHRTEIDELQGVVVALGERYGVATPVSERLVQLVVDAEERATKGEPPTPWSGPDLRTAVGL